MIKKFFISKKLNEYADRLEKNAVKEAEVAVKTIKSFNEKTEIFGVIAQIIASAYRLLRVILTVITTDSEEGKFFRALLVDMQKAYAKRLRDSAGFVTTLTKNKKIVRAIEAFEEDMDELKCAIKREYIQNKMADVDKLCEKLKSMLRKIRKNTTDSKLIGESFVYEKAYQEYVLAARTRFAEMSASGEDDDGEAFARILHLEEALNSYPEVHEFCEDEKGWSWDITDTHRNCVPRRNKKDDE
jgi:cell fate (sporulation/competence/biofilm development) regulator YlbF (YheA/YmcA/DUF963 family)